MSSRRKLHFVATISATFISFAVLYLFGILLGSGLVMVCFTVVSIFRNDRHIYLYPPQPKNDLLLSGNDSNHTAVNVLTFNIFMRPSLWFVKNNANDYKNERLDFFIQHHLSSFGIICLQEMFSTLTFRQRKLICAAEEQGYKHAVVGGSAPLVVADSHLSLKIPFLDAGLVILSKYPVLETDAHYYRDGALIDGWAPKQILWALIDIPLIGRINLFNTHMQSTHTDWPTEAAEWARARQAKELSTFVWSKISANNFPALICGDFNLDAIGFPLEYNRLVGLFRADSTRSHFVVTNLMPRHEPTYAVQGERVLTLEKDWDKNMCLDYMIYIGLPVTPTAQVQSFPVVLGRWNQLSDHYGLSATLT